MISIDDWGIEIPDLQHFPANIRRQLTTILNPGRIKTDDDMVQAQVRLMTLIQEHHQAFCEAFANALLNEWHRKMIRGY